MSPSQVSSGWSQGWETGIVKDLSRDPSLDGTLIVKRVCTAFRRIPCRARSLSENHNNDTAYFEIPRNAPHGMPLQCSHEECMLSGRRFRYCEVCKLPVAKRNFVKRHGHGKINSAKELRKTIDRLYPCTFPITSTIVKHEETQKDSSFSPLNISTVSVSEEEVVSDEFDANCSQGTDNDSSSSSKCFDSRTYEKFCPISCQDQIFSKSMTLVPQRSVLVPNPLKEGDSPSPEFSDSASDPSLMELISMDEFFDLADTKPVPLVEPGKQVTEKDFFDAVLGMDFTQVFYRP